MCRDLRAFLGVKFVFADLFRVKDLTFRNSAPRSFRSTSFTLIRPHFLKTIALKADSKEHSIGRESKVRHLEKVVQELPSDAKQKFFQLHDCKRKKGKDLINGDKGRPPVPNRLFFLTLFKPGGDQTHVQKILLQILYTSGSYLAP